MNDKKILNFCNELKNLLDEYNFVLGVDIEGDTHGITENFVILDKGYNTLVTLNEHTAYLSAYDLKNYVEYMEQ